MPPIPKRKKQYKDQSRDAEGKYLSKRIYNANSKKLMKQGRRKI